MSKITAVNLRHQWRELYDKYKIQKKLARFSNNERHRIFNNLLLKYLFECQENQYLPSKDKLDENVSKILDESEHIYAMGDADESRVSTAKMDNALQQMSFAPIQTDQDERGMLPFPYLCIFGLVSIKGLTKFERLYICDCFNADYNVEYDAINIVLMKVPLNSEINEDKQDKINAFCLRVARERLNSYLIENINKGTDFKYPIMQKISDFFLDRSI